MIGVGLICWHCGKTTLSEERFVKSSVDSVVEEFHKLTQEQKQVEFSIGSFMKVSSDAKEGYGIVLASKIVKHSCDQCSIVARACRNSMVVYVQQWGRKK